MQKSDIVDTFAWNLKACRYAFFRLFLLKLLKGCFFQALRSNPQRTLDLLLFELLSSRHPVWSFQVLEFLGSVSKEELEAHQKVVSHFKRFQGSSTPDRILKARVFILSCFWIKESEIRKSLIDFTDIALNPFQTKQTDSITMVDLSPGNYKSINNWFRVHKLSAHEAANDKTGFYNLVKQCAEAGDLESKFILGLIYSEGYGVEKNTEQAIYWLRAAATQQHAYAQCTIGYMLFEGWGAEKDETQGMSWLEESARNGDKTAKLALKKLAHVCTSCAS
jgi:hypothetical protein